MQVIPNSALTRRGSSRLRNLALWCALAASTLASCGREDAASPQSDPLGHPVTDLLKRRPDLILTQVGEVHPREEDAWGEFDGDGWGDWLSKSPSGEGIVWTMSRISKLTLPAGPKRDRNLRLRLKAPDSTVLPGEITEDGEEQTLPATVTLRLNGRELGAVELRRELADAEVSAPAELWRQGNNSLELEVNRMSQGTAGLWHGLGLSSVRYDQPIEAETFPDSEQLVLGPAAGVVYTFITENDSSLAIDAVASSSGATGQLDVSIRRHSPETDKTEPLNDEPLRLAMVAGRITESLRLPPADGGVLEVQLEWVTDSDAHLEFERLEWLERERRSRPPIVFISVDTLAARNMSLYGYARKTTPHLEEFAKDAITFTNCRSNAPRTLRSYLSQLSGLYSEAHFVENTTERNWRPPVEEHQLAPNRWTLPEQLRAGGWTTAAWVDNPWLVNGVGLRQGFDVYDTSAGEIAHWGSGSDPNGGLRHITPQVEDWIDELPEGTAPFLFVQMLDVHGPYMPVKPWQGTFKGDELYEEERREPVAEDMVDVFGMVPTYIARGVYGDEELPETIATGPLSAAYDEKILELDAGLGEFFDSLKESGLYDRAIIVFSADHGESLLEHDFFFGHGTLYSENLGVPLIVRLPGGENGGRTVETAVQLVDLYPTMADLAGLPRETITHGRSLAPALRGETLEPKPLFAEGGVMKQYSLEYDGWKLIESWPSQASFQTMLSHSRIDSEVLERIPGLDEAMISNRQLRLYFKANPERYRYLLDALQGPIRELYHIREDKTESNDLAGQYPERVAELMELLKVEVERTQRAQAMAKPHVATVELSAEEIERLIGLGYMEGNELEENEPDPENTPDQEHGE